MHPIAFLALLTIVLLALAALKLELNFRRAAEEGPSPGPGRGEAGPAGPGLKPSGPRPELHAAPAGGYCQAPYSRSA